MKERLEVFMMTSLIDDAEASLLDLDDRSHAL